MTLEFSGIEAFKVLKLDNITKRVNVSRKKETQGLKLGELKY